MRTFTRRRRAAAAVTAAALGLTGLALTASPASAGGPPPIPTAPFSTALLCTFDVSGAADYSSDPGGSFDAFLPVVRDTVAGLVLPLVLEGDAGGMENAPFAEYTSTIGQDFQTLVDSAYVTTVAPEIDLALAGAGLPVPPSDIAFLELDFDQLTTTTPSPAGPGTMVGGAAFSTGPTATFSNDADNAYVELGNIAVGAYGILVDPGTQRPDLAPFDVTTNFWTDPPVGEQSVTGVTFSIDFILGFDGTMFAAPINRIGVTGAAGTCVPGTLPGLGTDVYQGTFAPTGGSDPAAGGTTTMEIDATLGTSELRVNALGLTPGTTYRADVDAGTCASPSSVLTESKLSQASAGGTLKTTTTYDTAFDVPGSVSLVKDPFGTPETVACTDVTWMYNEVDGNLMAIGGGPRVGTASVQRRADQTKARAVAKSATPSTTYAVTVNDDSCAAGGGALLKQDPAGDDVPPNTFVLTKNPSDTTLTTDANGFATGNRTNPYVANPGTASVVFSNGGTAELCADLS